MFIIVDNYCVYMHVFPNNKKYIGLTKRDPEKRWGKYGEGYKDQPIYEYINLYGWDSVDHYIISEGLSREEAIELEKESIALYHTTDPECGYNIKEGGEAGGNSWNQYEYNGKLYDSNELASLSPHDLNNHDITNRINSHGWTIERVISQEKESRNNIWEYNGNKYSSEELAKLSELKGAFVSKKDITGRLSRGWDIERAITQPKNIKKQPFGIGERIYEYNGELYNSYELSKLSPYDLKSSDITNRINHHGWTVEKAVNTPKKKCNTLYEYKGKKYKSTELCNIYPELGLTHNNITDRLRQGWSIERAVETPKQTHN